MATARTLSISRQLREDLNLRLSALATPVTPVTLGSDANGDATIAIGTQSAGSQAAFIRVKEVGTSVFTNSIGGTQTVYGPNVIQVVLEQLSGNTGTLVMQSINLVKMFGELFRHHVKIELYLTTNTTAVSVAGITGTPATTFDALWNPLTSSM